MTTDFALQLKKIIDFETDFLLSKVTTWQTGGPASFLVKPKSSDQVLDVIKLTKESKIPWLILGKGSNVLISDQGFKGVVLKLEMNKIEKKNGKIKAQAGASFTELGLFAATQGLPGLEFAATIPGTVGGAIRGNAGAFGGGTQNFLESREVLDCQMEISEPVVVLVPHQISAMSREILLSMQQPSQHLKDNQSPILMPETRNIWLLHTSPPRLRGEI